MFAIIDTESSGGQVGEEKIIDIAIFLFDGEKVIDQFISLVNPEKSIQPFVEKMTGITNASVRRAPRFHEVAKRIVEITENAVLIGHNIAFDYRMLRQEFAALGYPYEKETLDTLFLAEGLIPGLPAYGLSKLCKELNIVNSAKHRAEGDARATLELFEILIQKDEKKSLFGIRSMFTGSPKEARGEKLRHLLRKVTTGHGIYYVFDGEGKCIYLCPLHQAKENITRKFLSDVPSDKQFQALAREAEHENMPTKWLANWKIYSEYDRLKPSLNTKIPIPQQRMAIVIHEDGSYRYQKNGDNGLVYLTSSFLAGRLCKLLNENLEETGVNASENHLREVVLQDALVVEEIKGRKFAEKTYLVWKDYRLKGYIFTGLKESLKRKDALEKRLIPLSDDSIGFGIWLENTKHFILAVKQT
ncbi:MAG: 3'-5' exonuclease [Cryomorphaceae bacterium]|nr:3'-5' exonuclease [Cryomorphaceae bacterium]